MRPPLFSHPACLEHEAGEGPERPAAPPAAVAARHALDTFDVRRVFIFDWDVHHGDGTNDIFRTSDAVLSASICQSGIYPGAGRCMTRQRRGRGLLDQPASPGAL